jgi:hypothetical protein
MLEEINRAAREIDDEEAALRVIRERELQDESTPIEPPGQGRPRAGDPLPTSTGIPSTSSKDPAPTPAPAPAQPEQPPADQGEVGQAPVAAGRKR